MKDLAPDIFRKRLLIQGYFSITVTEETIREFFEHLTGSLKLMTYGAPIIHHTSGVGKDENQGYGCLRTFNRFGNLPSCMGQSKVPFSCYLYTCKDFDDQLAVRETKGFFGIKETAHRGF